ncbi:MAG: isopentenyl-diphosphate Delta-isomerase [Flavobacteriales bacterium]|nr:isopentenyl-diphosphate Delta-isomerase [Flavobacteriales bacterium]
MEEVILVDRDDNAIGTMEKMEAHEKGLLHRAFSVFIFNSKGQLLLQRRADTKYHSGGLWTNSCCSHPRKGETVQEAAARRVEEELGIEVNSEQLFSFIYKAELDNNLIEHELDHVLIGNYENAPVPNAEEVMEWKYADMDFIQKDIQEQPDLYTAWFKIILEKYLEHLKH